MRRTVTAAGGLLWRERGGAVEVAAVHRPKHQDWSLPKGKLLPGEHPLAGAYREVVEETGVRPVVGVRLPSVRYPVLVADGAADKVVHYWAMCADRETEFTPTAEVDALRWVRLDELGAALSYPRDEEVAAAFAALPAPLRTVVLVHHARAAADWEGPDVTRPLDDAGTVTAHRICDLLALFGPVRVMSATPRRCVQTVAPVAHRRNLEIEPDGVFDAESHAKAPEVTADRLVDLALATEGPVVVCSQAGVVPDTVALLADTDGLTVPNVRTPEGAAWVLTFHESRLVAADFLSPKS